LAWYLEYPLKSTPIVPPKRRKQEEEGKDGHTLSKIQRFDNGSVGLKREGATRFLRRLFYDEMLKRWEAILMPTNRFNILCEFRGSERTKPYLRSECKPLLTL
jgi:hypothetical protein